jgi:hypothetical protein
MNTFSLAQSKLKRLQSLFQSHHSVIWVACIAAILAGMYGSLKVVTAQFGIDSDSSHSIMLWYGVKADGIGWIKDWFFTQDNWLLSLLPFHFLGFEIFGPRPAVVILFGWIIFVFSAFISGAIAWQLRAKKAALILSAVLLFFGYYAHEAGFVSYSTSHNITNLLGLVVFFLFFSWLNKPAPIKIIAAFVILFIGDFSDPWMTAAYLLPLALSSLACIAFPTFFKIDRKGSLCWFLAVIAAVFLVKSQLLGVLSFLPVMSFAPGNWASSNHNTIMWIQDLGGLLNLIPFNQGNDFIPSLLSLIILISLLVYLGFKALQAGYAQHRGGSAFLLLAALSIGGISMAFMISNQAAQYHSARFVLNCAYLILIALGILIEYNWSISSKIEKLIYVVVTILFVLSGAVSNYPDWKKPGFAFKDTGVLALIDFLKTNNLNYGYGSYWGSLSNAITAASKLEVIIRPVVFNPLSGMMVAGNRVESASTWYLEKDYPANQKDFFVFVASDFEECTDINICINGLIRQFGNPVKTLKYNGATVMVWDHPLIDFHQKQYPVDLNKTLFFNAQNNPPNGPGWSSPEAWGTWSDSDVASILLVFSTPPQQDLKLLINSQAYLADNHLNQEVQVLVNGQGVGVMNYTQDFNGAVRSFNVPKAIALEKNGRFLVQFKIKNPKAPSELGPSLDKRKLGIGIISIEIK